MAATLLYILPPLWPEELGQWYGLAILFPLLLTVNLFAARLVARRITKPLEWLAGNPERIRGRNRGEPILQVTHRDEIGTLVSTLSQIQHNVVELNEDEEFFYQSVPHGLKIPIMIIQNCCAAYQDGIYGSEAIDIIMEESLAAEAGIEKPLYVSPFDRMLDKQGDFRPAELRGLIEEYRRRFQDDERGTRLEADIPAGLTVPRNRAALRTVFNNSVENGLHYAASYIRMELTGEEEGGYLLTVENDGAPISQPILDVLFQKLYKEADDNFDLGLYITKETAQSHRRNIWAFNQADGVRFQLPLCREDRMVGRRQKGTMGS